MGLARVLKFVATALVSVGALAWALHDVDGTALLDRLERIPFTTLAAYASIQVLAMVARLVRWWFLAHPLAPTSGRIILKSGLLGIPAAFLLPLRLGEFVRPAVLARGGAPFAGAVAAVVVERVIDGLMNVALFFALFSILPASSSVSLELRALAVIALVGFGGVLVVLVAAAMSRDRVLSIVSRVVGRFSSKIADGAARLIGSFLDGLRGLGGGRRLLPLAVTSVVYWALHGWSVSLLASGQAHGISMLAGMFVVSASVLALTIPGGPGAIGTFEAGYRLAFSAFGVGPVDAAAISLSNHGFQVALFAVMIVAGLLLSDQSASPARTPCDRDSGS